MAGRHRDNSLSWRLPSVVGMLAILVLITVTWMTGLPWFGGSSTAITLPRALAQEPTATRPTASTTSSNPTSTTTTTTTTRTTTTTSTTTATSTTTTTSAPLVNTTTTTPPPPPSPTTTQPPTTEVTTQTPAPDTVQACPTELAGTRPHVAKVGNHLQQRFEIDAIGGRAPRPNGGDHPIGLALDLMVDTATGNKIANYVLAHQQQFGVKYVIWRQRINMGSGWEWMEDRGGPTANHYDHVHISFYAGVNVTVSC